MVELVSETNHNLQADVLSPWLGVAARRSIPARRTTAGSSEWAAKYMVTQCLIFGVGYQHIDLQSVCHNAPVGGTPCGTATPADGQRYGPPELQVQSIPIISVIRFQARARLNPGPLCGDTYFRFGIRRTWRSPITGTGPEIVIRVWPSLATPLDWTLGLEAVVEAEHCEISSFSFSW